MSDTREPALERDAELRRLQEVIAGAAGGRGQLAILEGPSGIGKSRLLIEAGALAGRAGAQVLRARGSELTGAFAFGVAVDLFEERLVRADPAARELALRGPAALAAPLLTRARDDAPATATDEFSVIHGLYWLAANLAEAEALALLVDDVHWADEPSLRFLAYLAQRLEDLPVALIVAVRTGDPSSDRPLIGELWETASPTVIRPRELSRAAVGSLLGDDALADTVWHETGGNPFLVVEVAAAIRAGETVSAADARVATPQSVRRQITRRLRRLGDDATALATAAAILGERMALSTSARLAGLSAEHAAVAAELLVAGQVLAATDPVAFAHPMIRSAIYGGLAPGERPLAHLRAAKLLAAEAADPETTAEHLLQAAPIEEAWAVAVLHEAGRASARKGVPEAAVRYLRRAVDGAPLETIAPALLVDLGLVEAAAGEGTSLRRFEQALGLLDEPAGQADTLYSLGQTLYRYGRYADAAAAFRRGAELFSGLDPGDASGAGDDDQRLRFEAAAWGADYYIAPPHRHPPRALGTATPLGPPGTSGPGERAMFAVEALHLALTTPPAGPAAQLALRALDGGRLLAEQTSDGVCVNLAIIALLHSGHVLEAGAAADAVLADARERGSRLAFAEASLIRALVMYTRGRVNHAAADVQAAVDAMSHGWHSFAPTAIAVLIHCMIERGELDAAAALVERAETELAPPEAAGINAFVFAARGRLRLWRGELDQAAADLHAAGESLRGYGLINPAVVPWRSLAGVIAHASGDTERGLCLIEEEIDLARRFEIPIYLGAALRRRALLQDGVVAEATLREAIAVLEPTEARLELARALTDLGAGRRRAGQRVDAREPLTRALDLAHRSGAIALADRARDELLAAGARPRRDTLSGLESLTPTEQRIAELAAEGHSNRAIAEITFVTPNTIAWHLRNVYRKLDINSREQLPNIPRP